MDVTELRGSFWKLAINYTHTAFQQYTPIYSLLATGILTAMTSHIPLSLGGSAFIIIINQTEASYSLKYRLNYRSIYGVKKFHSLRSEFHSILTLVE